MNIDRLINAYYYLLIVFFVFSIIALFFGSSHAELISMSSINEKKINEIVVDKSSSTLRDPTKPLGYVNEKPIVTEVLILQAVFVRSDNRSAVINEKYVSVGDVVAGHKVVTIGKKTVHLEKENNKIILNLRGGMRDFSP